jgi:hypothetical protein
MANKERLFLSQDQESYLAWLLTPEDVRTPKTKKAWAEEHGLHFNTVGQWEKKKNFAERWKLGVEGLSQSPERTQKLLDALYAKGIAGDVRSAELYLKATGYMQNISTVNVNKTESVKELTDDELHSLILEMSNKAIKNNPISAISGQAVTFGDYDDDNDDGL